MSNAAPKERRKSVGLRESRPAAVDPVPLTRVPAPRGKPVVVAVVGVQFRDAGVLYDFDSGDAYFGRGENVVVETNRGPAVGTVVRPTERRVQPAEGMLRVLRRIDANDSRARRRHEDREDSAFRVCLDVLRERGMPMKLVRAEYAHSGSKVVFYFVAEERVDFRDLVRTLSEKLHVRVEMRQLGIRDQAKLVGGIGSCGRELCCSTWLREFKAISIKMAKDQNLALNPQKVSGQCGRLKCCLSYEEETYRTMRKGMPKVGKNVTTPRGTGRVREVDVLRGLVRVSLDSGTETFNVDQVRRPGDAAAPAEAATANAVSSGKALRERAQEHADGKKPERKAAPPKARSRSEDAGSPPDGDTAGERKGGRRRRRRRRGRSKDPGDGGDRGGQGGSGDEG